MKKILYTFSFLLISCSSLAKKVIDNEVILEPVTCESSYCVKLSYVNPFDKAVCIKNTYFPYDGNLNENAFRLINPASAELSKYRLIEPSMVTNSRNAVLVRLVPPGGVATSTIDLASFYDIGKDQKYQIEYGVRAYFCNQYGHGEKFILLSGSTKKK